MNPEPSTWHPEPGTLNREPGTSHHESGATFRRYVQFCLVGGSGVAVDMIFIFLLASPSALGWNLSLSKVIAAEIALLNNFIWNDLWTFRGLATTTKHTQSINAPGPQDRDGVESIPTSVGGWRARLARFATFNLICTAGIGLSVLLLNLQVFVLHVNLYLANLIAIVLVSLWNFFLNSWFAWKPESSARQHVLRTSN